MTRTKTRMAAASGAVGGWPVLSPRFQFVAADAGRGEAGAVPHARRILVVEDEGLVALEIETFLTSAGHDVVGVAAGRAVALALARAERPDLALWTSASRTGTAASTSPPTFPRSACPCSS